MTHKDFDFLVFIGRFQPYHTGHKAVVDQALMQAHKVIILVGSTNKSRDNRDPFTFSERKKMIKAAHSEDEQARLIVVALPDKSYNDQAWIKSVQSVVTQTIVDTLYRASVGLIGHKKDETSYYLKMFPKWKAVSVAHYMDINGTDIRNFYFGHPDEGVDRANFDKPRLPWTTINYMQRFKETSIFWDLVKEHLHIKNYKAGWKNAPYPPIFVTVDAVVVQSGYVLLVKRNAQPGKGLLALPGGFVNEYEKLDNAVIRELREETRLKVPEPVIRGCVKERKTFDDPHRSTRGRTITHAYLIELPAQEELPKVKGSSDAEKAMWVPLSQLDSREMFEDHYGIVQIMLGTS